MKAPSDKALWITLIAACAIIWLVILAVALGVFR